MAYNFENLVQFGRTDLWGQHQEWKYWSTDPIATVKAPGYISNAKKMGLKVGNKVHVYDSVNVLNHTVQVVSINATTGAADLSDPTTYTATNT